MAYDPTVWKTGDVVSSYKLNKLENGLAGSYDEIARLDGDIDGLADDLDTEVAALRSQIGSPLVANTAEEMTNINKVYVYTGSETGYTAGHWYYFDGTEWADGGVYNSVAVQTDKTLTVPDMPADAKVTGDEIGALKEDLTGNIASFANTLNYYINANDEVTYNNLLSCSDYVPIPENAIAIEVANRTTKDSNVYHIVPCVLFYDASKNLLSKSANNTDDIVTEPIPTTAKYVRFNQPKANDPRYVHFVIFSFTDATGKWGHYSGAFTARQSKDTGIVLKANTDYIIHYNSVITRRISNFNSADSSYYKAVTPWINTILFRNGASTGNLTVYNSESALDALDIDVYEFGSIMEKANRVPAVYVVDKNSPGNGAYTSLTQCLLDLKDDDSEKIIYINGGDYDIHQEYIDANIPVYEGDDPSREYWDYNVFIPKNTHIIGRGTVRIMWMPDASDITENQSKTVSPVNVAGTMTLENVEIHCKNGRYCIHDDPLGKPEYTNAIKRYINVKCYKYANDNGYGFNPVIGFGIDTQMSYEFDNCYFKNYINERAFYMHSRTNSIAPRYGGGNIKVNNSILDCGTAAMCVKFGNVGGMNSNFKIAVGFYNCFIGGAIHLINESASQSTPLPNVYDLTLLNCGNPTIVVADTDNPYPPKVY